MRSPPKVLKQVATLGISADQLATLRFKDALRNLDANALNEVAPELREAGLPKAAALAEAEALFISKKWKAAADRYAEFLADDPLRVGVVERRAYALIKSRRSREAREILTQLPVNSIRAHSMLRFGAAAQSTKVAGMLILAVALPLLVAAYLVVLMQSAVAALIPILALNLWLVSRTGPGKYAVRVFMRSFDEELRGQLRGEISRLGRIL